MQVTDELSKAVFESDLADAQAANEASRWSFERRDGLEVWVTVSPAGHEAERFVARLLWRRYPDEPPSVHFIEPGTGALGVPKAWPKARGFRPPNDICATWTYEGFQLHAEWRTDPRYRWDSRGNVLLKTVRTLQQELDQTYEGKFQQ